MTVVEDTRRTWQALVAEPLRFDSKVEVPETPPTSWMAKPDWLEPGQKLTVLASGQAAGYWFQHGTCLVHDPKACPKPDPTGYRMFKQNGELPTIGEDGRIAGVEVGVIGNVHGHANPRATIAQAQAHYSDPDAAMLVGVCGDDEYGAWFAGCLLPDKEWTGRDVAFLNRCALSGDWRPLPYDSPWWEQNGVTRAAVMAADSYSSLGPTLVTRPALPLVKSFPMAASADDDARPVLLGGLGGVQLDDAEQAYSDPQPCSCHERTASVPDEKPDEKEADMTATLTLDTSKVEEILMAALAPVQKRLDDLNARFDAADEATAAEHRSRVASIDLPDLPEPEGFSERTWIEYTIADLEWLEMSGRVAAPQPSPKSAPDRGSDQRKKDAQSGVAMSDGSYPIRNAGDLANAKQAIGRAPASKRRAVIAHINARAKALGLQGVGSSSSDSAAKKAA